MICNESHHHFSTTHTLNRTFASKTLLDRLPKVLTQIIDTLHRYQPTAQKQHGDVRRWGEEEEGGGEIIDHIPNKYDLWGSSLSSVHVF